MPCLACGRSPVDAHHITTRGAGGDDVVENLLNLCRQHHAELHQIGIGRMSNKFPAIYKRLVELGRYDTLERAARFSNG